MATPYQLPSGSWRVHMSVGGTRENKTFETSEEAELWIAERKLARRRGLPVEKATRRRGGVTLAEFHETWSARRYANLAPGTLGKYRAYWSQHIEPRWGQATLPMITATKLDTWVADDLVGTIAPGTISGVVTLLGSILRDAVKAKLIPSNPRDDMARLPTVPVPLRRSATESELAAVLDASKGQYRIMWQLMAESGLRWAECAGLHGWALDLTDLDRARIQVISVVERDGTVRMYPKSKKPRWVPVSPAVAEDLRAHMLGRDPSGLVFTAEHGGPLLYHNVHGRVWQPTCEAAGVTLKIHELRHTAVTNWLDRGVGVHTVQELAGHADMRMVSRYAHMTGTAFDAARETMSR